MDEFMREYQCYLPDEDPIYERCYQIWFAYYHASEQFDRSICTAVFRGIACPATPEQRRAIATNTRRLLATVDWRRKAIGVSQTDERWLQAKKNALRDSERDPGSFSDSPQVGP